MTEDQKNFIEEVEVGEEILSWQTLEHPQQNRSKRWYVSIAIIGALLVTYAVWTNNNMFAIIILLMGVLLLVQGLQKPNLITIYITTLGIAIGNDFYEYKDVKDFSVIYSPPYVKLLYIDFPGILNPNVSISIEDIDPNIVREALLPYAFENLDREEEDLTDTLRRVYKL